MNVQTAQRQENRGVVPATATSHSCCPHSEHDATRYQVGQRGLPKVTALDCATLNPSTAPPAAAAIPASGPALPEIPERHVLCSSAGQQGLISWCAPTYTVS
jgi:hypothetical protein